MSTTIRPDFNRAHRRRILLIGCFITLAAICDFYALYTIITHGAAIDGQPHTPHSDARQDTVTSHVWLFGLLGTGAFFVLMLASFFGLYHLWCRQGNLFESVFDAMHEAVTITNAQGQLIYVNAAFRQMLDTDRRQTDKGIHGADWRTFFSGRCVAMMDRDILPVLAQTGYWCNEASLYRHDGSQLDVVLSLTRLPDGGMIGTFRDISARKQAQHDTHMLQQQVYQVQKLEALGRMAGGIAHDFNNVLAAMMGYAEFLIEDLAPDTPQHRFARGIMHSGTQARNLIGQILTFSRRSDTPRRTLDVVSVVHETLDMLSSGMPKSIAIETQIRPEKAYVHAGHTQLIQLFMNICLNARDAVDGRNGHIDVALDMLDHEDDRFADMPVTQDGDNSGASKPDIAIQTHGSRHTRLLLGRIKREESYIHITIKDNGCGISRTVMERIFDPFFTTKDSESGTGLGMSIIHGIICDLDGAMSIDSIQNKGTRFDIVLPACAPPQQNTEDARTLSGTGGELAADLQGEIVIIDDDDNVRIMFGHMLERHTIPAQSFTKPEEALSYIRRHADRIDCVITDYNMPDLTGLDVIEQLEEDYPVLPFIIITGYSSEYLRHVMHDYPGLRAILHKPVQAQELIMAIQRVVLTAPEDNA